MRPKWLAFGLAIFFAPAPAVAGTYTLATVGASTTISANCTISATGVSFGAYDPIGAQKTAALDNGTAQITITCIKGSTPVPTIALDLGLNASGSARRMKNTLTTDYLGYELYQPPSNVAGTACDFGGTLTVWGSAGGNLFSPPAPPSKAARSYFLCARVPAGQDPGVGTYNDTITATVNF